MSAIVIVEGHTDARILQVVLPASLQKNTMILMAGDRGSLPSIARTMLVKAHKPVAVLVDTDSVDRAIIHERLQTTEELLKSVSGRIPVKVIPLIPTIEALFFEAPGLMQKLFPSTVTSELLLLAEHDPKEALSQLLGIKADLPLIGKLLDRLDDEDVEKLRATRPMAELLDFLSRVATTAAPS
jgi:hypothetical protein